MDILVVGVIAMDRVETPCAQRDEALGGPAAYFAAAASLYAPVHLVAVVGDDFPAEHVAFFRSRGVDLQGLSTVSGRTFRWGARYDADFGDAHTLYTDLNVFADFHPVVPSALRDTPLVFLANLEPALQLEVLAQLRAPRLTVLDSMNYWIIHTPDTLAKAIAKVDVLLFNETEVRMFTGQERLSAGVRDLLQMGPKALIVKQGARGATLFAREPDGAPCGASPLFISPAYPVEQVVDPTGAGDTFAAGFLGHLARTGDLSLAGLRRAVVHGSLVASYTLSDFSIDALRDLTYDQIQARYEAFRRLTHFDALPADDLARLARAL